MSYLLCRSRGARELVAGLLMVDSVTNPSPAMPPSRDSHELHAAGAAGVGLL